tara:strand:- start:437 stop:1222 length:786 start_codon:yes stop_codon:yes gene_type:complete
MAEAQTLTYDANEQPEGELNAEEQSALEVGEKLAEQQSELLAGKFKTAEDLEKSYIELQKKLGSQEKETEEETTETIEEKVEEKVEETKVDTSFLDTLWEEAQGEFTKETLNKLQEMKPQDVAQMYLQYRSEAKPAEESTGLSDEDVKSLQGVVGGKDQYTEMMKWANNNLSENEAKMYDAVMDKGDPLAAFFAVQALTYRFNDSRGVEGQMLQGKAPTEKGDTFRSQAEVVRAMSDPKYDSDPAYRQDIYDKLERSNLKF